MLRSVIVILIVSVLFISCKEAEDKQDQDSQSKLEFTDDENNRPNILVVLCDDLGYADVGFNGSKDIITPNLDKLADNGVIFTSAYNTHAFCGPSRASIMTGRYPHCIGTPYNLRENGSRPNIGVPKEETYISKVLQDEGYHTAAIGKWHLGFGSGFQPNDRGFTEFYGFLGGGHDYFPDKFKANYKKQVEAGVSPIREYIRPLMHNLKEVDESEYITDALSREAVRVIHESSDMKKPFFMYLAYNAPHVPLQAKEEDLQKFNSIEDKDRRTYAGMVYAVDRGMGEIVNALTETGQLGNTLIVFFSDNGGNTDHGANNAPLKGRKGDTWEGGYRTPMFFHWPDKIVTHQQFDGLVSSLDLYPTIAKIANAKIDESKILDGLDLTEDLLNGKSTLKDRKIYALRYREGYCDVGIRQGDWKATRMANEPWGVYNVTNDIGEKKNKSGIHKERLKEMVSDALKWSEGHIQPLWFYSQKDVELWEDDVLPGYESTFEIDKLVAPAQIKNK